MTDLPHMPLFVDDYEAHTAHLTLEEDGAYNRLLRLCWRTSGCSVPNDDAWIMRRMRVSKEDFDRVLGPIIDEFFIRKSGRLFSKRQQVEYGVANQLARKRKAAGSKGGLAKARKLNDSTSSKAVAPITITIPIKEKDKKEVEADTSPELDLEEKKLKKAKPKPPPEETPLSVLCEVVSKKTAQEFILHRNKLKKPMTAHAARLVANKAMGQRNVEELFATAIERGWQTVYPKEKPDAAKMDPTVARALRMGGGR